MRYILARSCLGAAIVLSACAPKDAAREPQASVPPHWIEVDAHDFAYDMPDSVPAGLTTVVMRNGGKELHHVQLMRLEEGKTMADYVAAISADSFPPWGVHVGGPQAVIPGDSSMVTLELTPGHYAAFCVIPSPGPDAVMHLMKGMSKEFEVTGEPPANVVAPTPDDTLILNDYSFALSEPLTSGEHVVRVVNNGAQWHEVVFVLLAPGKKPEDILTWMGNAMEGPPPGRPIGGTVGLDPGLSNDVTLHLEAGTYGLFCFLPDATDRQPHFMHGMVSSLTVS